MGKTYKDFYNNDGFRDYHALNHAKTEKNMRAGKIWKKVIGELIPFVFDYAQFRYSFKFIKKFEEQNLLA